MGLPGLNRGLADKRYLRRRGRWADNTYPLFVAHRCNANVWPENTLEAARAAFNTGLTCINFDTWPLTDGGLGVMHDQTVDRTTSSHGNITDLDSAAVMQLAIPTPSWFLVNCGFGNLKVPLGPQIFYEFGNRVVFELEAKPYTGSGAQLVKAIQAYGVDYACRIASFSMSELAACVNAGIPACYLTTQANRAGTTPATLTAAGVGWVGIDITDPNLVPQSAMTAEIARWHAAGIFVHGYTALRRIDVWPALLGGVDSIACDDAGYVQPTWTPRTTDPFKSGNWPQGMIAPGGVQSLGTRGQFLGPIGAARWAHAATGAGGVITGWTVQGWGCPISGAIESTLQTAVAAGATTLRLGPQNKPRAGKALTVDGAPGSLGVAAVSSGGSFAAGTYFWVATATVPSGETVASVERSAAIVASGSATVTGHVPAGTTQINIYRGTVGGAENVLAGTVSPSGATFSFTDTGGGTAQSPPTGAAAVTEVVTPVVDGTLNTDSTWSVTVPALANAHAAGARVYGGAFTITFDLTADALGSDITRWASIVVASPDDTKYQDSGAVTDTGHIAHLRMNGQLQVSGRRTGPVMAGAPSSEVNTAALQVPTLSAALAASVAITSLPVNALTAAVASGAQFMLPTGQKAVASAAVAAAATAIPIASITPSAAVASGATIPQTATIKIQRTATSVVVTRADTNQSQTFTDTSLFGGYFHFGYNATGLTGMQCSFSNVLVTTP